MEWINNWWASLELFEQILYCIALPSTLFLLIQAVLIVVGAGGDVDCGGVDVESGGSVDGRVPGDFSTASMFTFQGAASFFCVFGWTALLMLRLGIHWMLGGAIAFVLGVIVMYLIAKLMFLLTKLAHSGTLEVKNLLGSAGTVYLRIPAKGEGKGKVMVQTSERLVEFDAVSDGELIPNDAPIRVVDVMGENILVVEAV